MVEDFGAYAGNDRDASDNDQAEDEGIFKDLSAPLVAQDTRGQAPGCSSPADGR